ncbi:hypothetical protein [Flavobacterium sp.]|uniref:hypothetical protein n=1 Tax=Flavobacterium sp. TaxID=239 RepID=UPI00261C7E87|nr:hypothetical protein [Flavobacterium sp.]
MNVYLLTAALLAGVLLYYFLFAGKKKSITVLYFGLIIGVFTFFIYRVDKSCFGASTPIELKLTNKSEQRLKIYTITFWDDVDRQTQGATIYHAELSANETSAFCLENDNSNFWLVAKDSRNQIVYLNKVLDNGTSLFYEIPRMSTVIKDGNVNLASKLTRSTDKSLAIERVMLWINTALVCLICVLFFYHKV